MDAYASAMLATMAAILPTTPNMSVLALFTFILALLPLCYSIIQILITNFPRLEGPKGSLIYFGGIVANEEITYQEALLNYKTSDLLDDYARQCYRNAEIASAKFKAVKHSSIALFISFIPWLTTICLFFNIKYQVVS